MNLKNKLNFPPRLILGPTLFKESQVFCHNMLREISWPHFAFRKKNWRKDKTNNTNHWDEYVAVKPFFTNHDCWLMAPSSSVSGLGLGGRSGSTAGPYYPPQPPLRAPETRRLPPKPPHTNPGFPLRCIVWINYRTVYRQVSYPERADLRWLVMSRKLGGPLFPSRGFSTEVFGKYGVEYGSTARAAGSDPLLPSALDLEILTPHSLLNSWCVRILETLKCSEISGIRGGNKSQELLLPQAL